MATDKPDTCYQESGLHTYQHFLEHSGEHRDIKRGISSVLSTEFQRIGDGKRSLDVLGVGSGGGQMDVHMLTQLQATFPGVPITSDVVDGSIKLTNNFKALVAKTADLRTVPFSWHIMASEDYIKQSKAKGDAKKFDFIHMIHMIYYVDDMAATIQWYQGLLKENGRLMIIITAADGGWNTLWKTFKTDLFNLPDTDHRTSREVKACLDKLGLKYDEHQIPNEFDISECFDPNSEKGHVLLNFITGKDDFYTDYTAETRAAILDLLKNKCSKQKDGKIMYNSNMCCFFVHA